MEINICLQGLNNSSTLLGVSALRKSLQIKWHKGDTFFRLCKSWLHDFLFKKKQSYGCIQPISVSSFKNHPSERQSEL